MIPSTTEVELITSAERLLEVAAILNRTTELAVDLEMDSLHHYQEKVCLIQISTRTESWLIDPLALESVEPLAASLGNPDTLIVMHGADYDVRSLYRDFGIEINNLFDTMVASRFLGITEFGLAALLKARFDMQLDKKYQKADWSMRPLTLEMRRYAAEDTSLLLPLFDQLKAELSETGRQGWVEEECRLVCQVRVNEKNGPLFMSCKGAGKLSRQSLTILEPLLQLRDLHARKLDRPPFKVMSAETLLEIAEKRPRTLSELAAVKGMTPGQVQRFGAALLDIVIEHAETPLERQLLYPRTPRVENSEGYKERLKRIKEWRESYSRTMRLEPGLLAPNWLLEAAAEQRPGTMGELDTLANMRNWQKQLFGDDLLRELAR